MATLSIRTDIGDWPGALSAQAFIDQLEALAPDEPLTLRINSMGGSVFESLAMYAALQRHGGHITAEIEGIAASSASFLIMAADEIQIHESAFLMVHLSAAGAIGNKVDLRKLADTLEQIDGTISGILAKRTGGSPRDWLAAMTLETWFTAAELQAIGIASMIPAKGPAAPTAATMKATNAVNNRTPAMRAIINRLTAARPAPRPADWRLENELARIALRADQVTQEVIRDQRLHNREAIAANANTKSQAARFLAWS